MPRTEQRSRVAEFLSARPWAMRQQTLEALAEIVVRHVEGGTVAEAEILQIVAARDARRQEQDARAYTMHDGIAVVPVSGVIARYSSQVNGVSQARGRSMESLRADVQQALDDPAVDAILLDVDSPGGSVDGVTEAADLLREANDTKPLYALADGMMASAAYWLGSQARRVFATRGSTIGSIGVYAVLRDSSERFAKDGERVHVVRSAPMKGRGMPGEALDDETLADVQRSVDEWHGLFVDAVQRGRGIAASHAQKLADGRDYLGRRAVEVGLVDQIATFDQAVAAIRAELDEMDFHPVAADGRGAGTPTEDAEMTTPKQGAAPAPEAPATPTPEALASARAEGARLERERASAIRAAATASQRELAERLVAEGATLEAARTALHDDLRAQHDRILAARDRDMQPVGSVAESGPAGRSASSDIVEDLPANGSGDSFEARALREYEADASLAKRWGSFELFLASRRNAQRVARRDGRRDA